ncbi:MAG TPA: 50S ribosomal protein L28 [Phycisphaerales bacterium]|nr:50S ribosomal protein L28 [Phycisphaerales bacterium]
MPRQCHFTGKQVTFGNRITRSGAAVKSGGFGLKTSGIARRTFKPNLQKLSIVVDGKTVRANVSAKAIRMGLVVRPLKRKYGYTAQQKAASH